MIINKLYLAVLPLVHMNNGLTEQALTLFPDRNFAAHFAPAEADNYIAFFQSRAETVLSGGSVIKYEFFKEGTPSGHVVVRVDQYVR